MMKKKPFYRNVDTENGPMPIDKPVTTRCWIWTGGKTSVCRDKPRPVYGVFYGRYVDGVMKSMKAHRASYEIATGVEPGKLQVNHHCDNPLCVRPSHLYLGTQKENVANMWERGRNYDAQKNLRTGFGECSASFKLSWKIVDTIRYLYANGGFSQRRLAGIYGVANATISKIVLEQRWPNSKRGERNLT